MKHWFDKISTETDKMFGKVHMSVTKAKLWGPSLSTILNRASANVFINQFLTEVEPHGYVEWLILANEPFNSGSSASVNAWLLVTTNPTYKSLFDTLWSNPRVVPPRGKWGGGVRCHQCYKTRKRKTGTAGSDLSKHTIVQENPESNSGSQKNIKNPKLGQKSRATWLYSQF